MPQNDHSVAPSSSAGESGFRRSIVRGLGLGLLLLGASAKVAGNELPSAPAPGAVARGGVRGMVLGELQVGSVHYRDVQVRSMDGRSLVFTHQGGMASVRLRDLPPAIQKRLGLDAAKLVQQAEEAPKVMPVQRRSEWRRGNAGDDAERGGVEGLLPRLAEPPVLRDAWSLRGDFNAWRLEVKDQGRRPSCAIFAIVSALEFQMARQSGRTVRLSEDYLIWAVRRAQAGVVGGMASSNPERTADVEVDIGFTLPEVITALQMFGVAEHAEFSGQRAESGFPMVEPTVEMVERARNRRRVFIVALPGQRPLARMAAIIHSLHAGYPVPVGLRWPNERSIRAGVLSDQTPLANAAHAVTVVGYESPSRRLEDAVFIFKNSYGPRWGQGGYGRVAARYLEQHLLDAYVLESH